MRPDALLILLKPPSLTVQEERLRARGDDEAHIAKRLREGVDEERMGLEIADEIVVNGQLAQATADVAGIVERYRSAARGGGQAARPTVGTGSEASHPIPDDVPEGS